MLLSFIPIIKFLTLILGFPMEIQAIADGHVMPYILDPNFQDYLPVIPSEVNIFFLLSN